MCCDRDSIFIDIFVSFAIKSRFKLACYSTNFHERYRKVTYYFTVSMRDNLKLTYNLTGGKVCCSNNTSLSMRSPSITILFSITLFSFVFT